MAMSAVRIQFWLFVVTPTGSNNLLAVEEGQVYLNRGFPAWLTTTTTLASLSDTHISLFLFSPMYLKSAVEKEVGFCN